MNILLITDAWKPQVNGVVRTWSEVQRECTELGHRFDVIHPGEFKTFAMPRYPEIRLAIAPGRKLRQLVDQYKPDAIHIATEGPVGKAGRKLCKRRRWPFTTSYHTQFPQYLKRYTGLPLSATFPIFRRFHNAAAHTLVPTKQVKIELDSRGFTNVIVWSRGADTNMFQPYPKPGPYTDLPRPIFLYAGRVAIEKNIEAFLDLNLPGSKVVVGDGPPKARLQKKYPNVHWAGYQFGDDLAKHYAGGDVFVFPSKTDTFGVVMLEANACGLPVAAYPVTGPIDVVKQGVTGYVDDDLATAAVKALELDPAACRKYAMDNSWRRCAEIFLDHIQPIATDAFQRQLAAPAGR